MNLSNTTLTLTGLDIVLDAGKTVDSVDISVFKTSYDTHISDYNTNINQALKTTSTPTFNGLHLNTPANGTSAIDILSSGDTYTSPGYIWTDQTNYPNTFNLSYNNIIGLINQTSKSTSNIQLAGGIVYFQTGAANTVPSTRGYFNSSGLYIPTGNAYIQEGNLQLTSYSNGTLSVSGGIVVSSSDERLKTNIQYIQDDDHLKKILQLKPCSFSFKSNGYDKHTGFIAQDVEKIFPDIVDGKKYDYQPERDELGYAIFDNSLGEEKNQTTIKLTDKPRYRGLSDTGLIAHLTLAVQQLIKKNIESSDTITKQNDVIIPF
jgi:hypothetical protein